MSISMDQALGVHQYALGVHAERTRILASNLANIDTPNFKAKDIDFKDALRRIDQNLKSEGSIDAQKLDLSSSMKYRIPMQPSLDGNTSELHIEQASFSKNAMDFQTSLTFLKMKFSGIRTAIEGK